LKNLRFLVYLESNLVLVTFNLDFSTDRA